MDETVPAPSTIDQVAQAARWIAAPVVTVTPDLVIHSANPTFERRSGIPASFIVGRPTTDLLLGDVESIKELNRRLVDSEHDEATLHRRMRDNLGRERVVALQVRRVRSDDGATAGFVATLEDVSDRDEAVKSRADEADELLHIIEQLPMAVMVSSGDRVLFSNQFARELFGCPSTDALDAFINSKGHVHPDELDRADRRFQEVKQPGFDRSPHTWRILRTDGELRTVEWRTIPTVVRGDASLLFAVTDVTAKVAAERAVAESEAHARMVFDHVGEGVGVLDTDARFVDMNAAMSEILGLESPDIGVGASITAFPCVTRDGTPVLDHPALHSLRTGEIVGPIALGIGTGEHLRWIDGTFVPLAHFGEQPHGVLVSVHDVTEQLRTLDALAELRAALAESEARFRDLSESSPDMIVRLRREPLAFEYVNPAVEQSLGLTPQEIYDDPAAPFRQIHPDDRAIVEVVLGSDDPPDRFEIRMVHRDGTNRTLDVRLAPIREDGVIVGMDASARDITEAATLREQLEHLAHRDPLTGLMNRRALTGALRERIASGVPTAVLFVDLDGFKAVNDRHGHDAGDAVLVGVATRLTACVRGDDLVARFAGDEFVVATRPDAARKVSARLLDWVSEPVVLPNGQEASVGASIGVTLPDPASSDPVEDVLRRADEGMYLAKRRGKGQVVHL